MRTMLQLGSSNRDRFDQMSVLNPGLTHGLTPSLHNQNRTLNGRWTEDWSFQGFSTKGHHW